MSQRDSRMGWLRIRVRDAYLVVEGANVSRATHDLYAFPRSSSHPSRPISRVRAFGDIWMKTLEILGYLVAGLGLAASTASAADMPGRSVAPEPSYLSPEPVTRWTGFYVGAQAGAAMLRTNRSANDLTAGGWASGPAASWVGRGVVAGLHVGYNYLLDPAVVGFEADIEGASPRGNAQILDVNVAGFAQLTQTTNNMRSSLRARVGINYERFMPYVTGGLALGTFSTTLANFAGAQETASYTRLGWTFGGGLEYALTDALSVRAEYRYADFGKFGQTSGFAFPGSRYSTHLIDNSVRLAVSYHFSAPQTAIAVR